MGKWIDRLCKGLEYVIALFLAVMVVLVFGKVVRIDELVKSDKSPFDPSATSGLRANGGQIEIIYFIPFVVSLSNTEKTFDEVVRINYRGR